MHSTGAVEHHGTVLHTVHCTPHPIITQSVDISNYQQLPTIGQGVTRENQCLPTILFSEERGNCPRSMTSIYWYDLHISMSQPPPPPPSHLMRWPLLPSELKFCFQVCIDFPLSLSGKLDRQHTHTHTTPCLRRQQADITFYFTFLRLHRYYSALRTSLVN